MTNTEEPLSPDRRPIKTRSAGWSRAIARFLANIGVSPNQVSVAGIVFALLGGILFLTEAKGIGGVLPLIGAAICIQLRLLSNMLDGLIAVEGGRQTKLGELYNELPDRIDDVFLLAAAGYAAHFPGLGPVLGWSASVLAVTTAYIRALGARRGHAQDFSGPQAKPQRMFLLTVACLLAAGEKALHMVPHVLLVFLVVINIGTFITCIRRTGRLAGLLESA